MLYDTGDITTNAKPWAAGINQRTLSGGGLGLRDQGGKPTSDTAATDPLVWLSLGYRF